VWVVSSGCLVTAVSVMASSRNLANGRVQAHRRRPMSYAFPGTPG